MAEDIVNSCCSCNSGCCSPKPEKKKLMIDFLYLDLNTCTRCQGTDTNLDEAISEVSKVLEAAGYEISVNKVNITTEELAISYRFVSSPTIRINGRDIALEVKETLCEDCGDICGEDVDCRVWTYEDVDYNVPPKALIINAILQEVYTGQPEKATEPEYEIPENLKNFFEAMKKNR